MPRCPECGHDLPPDPEVAESEMFSGLGVPMPPTIEEIIDSIGYGY
jgi:hypothetical protein